MTPIRHFSQEQLTVARVRHAVAIARDLRDTPPEALDDAWTLHNISLACRMLAQTYGRVQDHRTAKALADHIFQEI